MSKSLVTGCTGSVGHALVKALVAQGRPVRCLVRNEAKAAPMLPGGVELVLGDVTDAASVEKSVQGCSTVFHAAGLPEQWQADPGIFERVNVGGTVNLIDASLRAGVRHFLYTSTQDLFDVQRDSFDETCKPQQPPTSAYEVSKTKADNLVEAAMVRGLPAIFIHPAAVYGPIPGAPTGTTRFLNDLLTGKVPMLLPGGLALVLNEDIAQAQLAAEAKAPVGARYLLAESWQSLRQIAEEMVRASPGVKVPPVMPLWVAKLVAGVGQTVSSWTGKPPILTRSELNVLVRRGRPNAAKAKRELGWQPTPFAAGIARTVRALKEQGR